VGIEALLRSGPVSLTKRNRIVAVALSTPHYMDLLKGTAQYGPAKLALERLLKRAPPTRTR